MLLKKEEVYYETGPNTAAGLFLGETVGGSNTACKTAGDLTEPNMKKTTPTYLLSGTAFGHVSVN